MGKDRFSRFKRENYDNEFRYGDNTYKRSVKIEDRLSHKQKDWLLEVIRSKRLLDWELKFFQKLIINNKKPTEKQRDLILKIKDRVANRELRRQLIEDGAIPDSFGVVYFAEGIYLLPDGSTDS